MTGMSDFLGRASGRGESRKATFGATLRRGAALLALAACGSVLTRPGAAEEPSAPVDDESRSEIKRAYSTAPDRPPRDPAPGDAPSVSDPSDSPKADDTFSIERQIAHAMKNSSERRTEDFVDLDRAYREVLSRSSRPEVLAAPGVLEGFKKGLTKNFTENPGYKRFRKMVLKRVKRLESDEEALAYTIHRDDDGTAIKMRWWMRKSGDRWRIYDLEDLDGGIRLSAGMSVAFEFLLGEKPDPRIEQTMKTMGAATRLIIAKRFDDAEPLLRSTIGGPLPRPFMALREMQLGAILAIRGQFADALPFLDRALELQADMPAAVLLHASCYNGLGRYEEALVQGRRYIDMLGSDDTGYFTIGVSLSNLGRT
jgi:hypothetical protein